MNVIRRWTLRGANPGPKPKHATRTFSSAPERDQFTTEHLPRGGQSAAMSRTTVTIAHTVFCIPFAYLPIRARLEGMDRLLAEAAADLYANEWQTFRRVTLPLLWPGILSGAMLAFIISLDDFVITYFVAGAGATTLPVYIFGMIRIGISPEVNAISTLMLAISVLFVSSSYLVARRRS